MRLFVVIFYEFFCTLIYEMCYTFIGKWEKKQLTYKVVQYSSKLRKEDVDRELAKAFGIWQKNSALSFRAVSVTQPADIEVRFTSQGIHNARFDGPGGTLAYAFFPVSFIFSLY